MGMGRMVATSAIVVAGLGVLGACGWDITKEKATSTERITDEFTRVQFTNDAGNVKITDGSRASVKRVVHYENTQPGPTHRVEDGALILEPCPVDDCWIDYEVVVPAGTTVDGELHSGNAEVSRVAGVNLRADSGNVTVEDIAGAVNVDVDSGNADLTGIRGAVQVQADSGNITITLAGRNDVRAKVSSGDVDVTVPKGAYRVHTRVDSGDVVSAVTNDERADRSLDLIADSGDITIATS
jgi:hypothetical protein